MSDHTEPEHSGSPRRQLLLRSLGWGAYDIGTSAYYLVFPLYLFPVYLASGAFKGDSNFELYWGLTQGAAVLCAVLVGLLFARRFDSLGVVRVSSVLMVATPCVLAIVPITVAVGANGMALLAAFAIAHGVHLLSLTAYDASLTRVASRGEQRARISSWAWGWGYLGGVACLGLMEVGLRYYPRYSAWDFGAATAFYFVAAVVAAWWMRRRSRERLPSRPIENEAPSQRDRVDGTWTTPWLLLAMMMLMVDGIAVFMTYMGLYATRVQGLAERDMTWMFALLQLLAFPLTGWVGSVGSRNPSRTLFLCGVGWCVTTAILLRANDTRGMLATIIAASVVVGSTQAMIRALYADATATLREVEGFSRYAVVTEGAAFVAPVLAGVLIPRTGYPPVLIGAAAMILIGGAGIWLLGSRQAS